MMNWWWLLQLLIQSPSSLLWATWGDRILSVKSGSASHPSQWVLDIPSPAIQDDSHIYVQGGATFQAQVLQHTPGQRLNDLSTNASSHLANRLDTFMHPWPQTQAKKSTESQFRRSGSSRLNWHRWSFLTCCCFSDSGQPLSQVAGRWEHRRKDPCRGPWKQMWSNASHKGLLRQVRPWAHLLPSQSLNSHTVNQSVESCSYSFTLCRVYIENDD